MRWAALALAALVAAGAVATYARPRLVWSIEVPMPDEPPSASPSNIERRDYVGPRVCQECHEEKFDSWRGHLHRQMNALVGDAQVAGRFDGTTVRYGGGRARFYRVGAELRAELVDGRRVRRELVVTRTIGSHYIQEYVVRQLEGPEPAGHRIYSTEIRLPFGYWRRKNAWFHQQYYDSWFGPEYDGAGLRIDPFEPELESWEPRCPWCHNTYAFDLRILRSQGPLHIGNGIERFVAMTAEEPSERARSAQHSALPLGELVTVGISCESCHLGGRAHAEEEQDMHFGPVSPRIRAAPEATWLSRGRDEPRVLNALCAQCHSAPSPRFPNGAARRNSSEATDLAASSCAPAIACVDCHDPHVRGSPAVADRALEACQRCHAGLADPVAARAHSRHAGEAASCLDCHMPRWVQGFSGVIRSHRIGRAFDLDMVRAGQPNACNLCHLDRSVAWARKQLAMYWRPVEGARDQGEVEPAGPTWLASADPFIVVTAAAAYARSPLGPAALPEILRRLDQPIAYYRMRVLFAVEEIIGRELRGDEFDPTGPPAARARQLRGLTNRLSGTRGSPRNRGAGSGVWQGTRDMLGR